MNLKYLSIEEAAKRAGKEKFFQNVKAAAVIRRFLERGLLYGKKEKNRQLVADDDALARIMQLGVEPFVYNQQGYSFMAVRAPIHQMAPKLKARPGVATYVWDGRVGDTLRRWADLADGHGNGGRPSGPHLSTDLTPQIRIYYRHGHTTFSDYD